MTVTAKSREKSDILAKLEKLLDVAGTQTPWSELAYELRRVPIRELRALLYRIERALAESYENSQMRGSAVDLRWNQQP